MSWNALWNRLSKYYISGIRRSHFNYSLYEAFLILFLSHWWFAPACVCRHSDNKQVFCIELQSHVHYLFQILDDHQSTSLVLWTMHKAINLLIYVQISVCSLALHPEVKGSYPSVSVASETDGIEIVYVWHMDLTLILNHFLFHMDIYAYDLSECIFHKWLTFCNYYLIISDSWWQEMWLWIHRALLQPYIILH